MQKAHLVKLKLPEINPRNQSANIPICICTPFFFSSHFVYLSVCELTVHQYSKINSNLCFSADWQLMDCSKFYYNYRLFLAADPQVWTHCIFRGQCRGQLRFPQRFQCWRSKIDRKIVEFCNFFLGDWTFDFLHLNLQLFPLSLVMRPSRS